MSSRAGEGDRAQLPAPRRTSFHLSSASNSSSASRKARSVDPGSTAASSESASISSPPAALSPWPASVQRRNSHNALPIPTSAPRSSPRQSPGEPSSLEDDGHLSAPDSRPLFSQKSKSLGGDSAFRYSSLGFTADSDKTNRLSGSSAFSLGSGIMNSAWGSASSSVAGSEAEWDGATTASYPVSVTAQGQSGGLGASPSRHSLYTSDRSLPADPGLAYSQNGSSTQPMLGGQSSATRASSSARQSRSRQPPSSRRVSGSFDTRRSSPGSDRSALASKDNKDAESTRPKNGIIGVCALDAKARSKPSRNILNRINSKGDFEVIIFGDKIILDEEAENWPVCDYLISFFSDGFPLQKAIYYVRLRRPFVVNDLPMQMVLWDRRICLRILDRFNVPTPRRVEVTRDGGPRLPNAELARHVYERTGVRLNGPADGTGGGDPLPKSVTMVDEDTISVDGAQLRKPFVEKPVSGEDHNIHIYFPSEVGGGGRRLFRKINNKSSEADESLNLPRAITDGKSSYVFEAFLSSQNHEDVKAYTVGPDYCHAETRKSPVVDGIVKRNTHGKEIRYVTSLTPEESRMAAKVAEGFGQRICGFDMLRAGNKSYVIDVNGWSFVKDNTDYYDRCASILRELFLKEKLRREGKTASADGENSVDNSVTSPNHATGPFSALKSILKSPSMSRLAGNHHNATKVHDLSAQTSPLTSPPSFESAMGYKMPPPPPLPPQHSEISLPPAASGVNIAVPDAAPDDEAKKVPPPAAKAQWKLKGMVAVIRHADRTPKQKFKFTFHTKPFVELLKGHREEVLLTGDAALASVMDAVKKAATEGIEDPEKLKLLRTSLLKKGGWPGTKVQIKPLFRPKETEGQSDKNVNKETSDEPAKDEPSKEPAEETVPIPKDILAGQALGMHDERTLGLDPAHTKRHGSITGMTRSRVVAAQDNLDIEKLQLIVKWGGEPTHSALYQSKELGENMRNDLLLMNKETLDNVSVFSSSERRVTTSAYIWTAAFLNQKEVPPDYVHIRKDLLDDSNAAKDEMDKVKKKLKGLLRKGNKAPPQFAWPENMPEPYIIARNTVELMKFHRRVMRENFSKLYGGAASSLAASVKSPVGAPTASAAPTSISLAQAVSDIQPRWCCGEDAELFKERWEKLFDEFCDPEKIDPSKISELHDTMKFDSLHNRPFLEWVFTPSQALLDEFFPSESSRRSSPGVEPEPNTRPFARAESRHSTAEKANSLSERAGSASERNGERVPAGSRYPFRKRSEVDPATLQTTASDPATQSYFNLFTGDLRSRARTDVRLEKLRELFSYSKILFDFIGPQEYGILDAEKLEIGLLTSLPLLKAIVNDLEDMQASDEARTVAYFTKESHIYTLLNCIIEGGINTKIQRNKIPELDYLSTICFELYESQNHTDDDESASFNYSIRITISPGCHTFEPLDVQLDSKHCIGFAQRRSLTAHNDWKQVIETLRAKFHTVKLPKSFIAVNLSEKEPEEFGGAGEYPDDLGRLPPDLTGLA